MVPGRVEGRAGGAARQVGRTSTGTEEACRQGRQGRPAGADKPGPAPLFTAWSQRLV